METNDLILGILVSILVLIYACMCALLYVKLKKDKKVANENVIFFNHDKSIDNPIGYATDVRKDKYGYITFTMHLFPIKEEENNGDK